MCASKHFSSLKATYVGVSFGGSVELSDVLDVEALLEVGPDLRSQSVAKHDPHLVSLVVGGGWPGHQVATYLTYVLSYLK